MPVNYFSSLGEAISASFQLLWIRIASFFPQLVGAIVIFIVGLLIAYALSGLVKKLIEWTRVDQHLHNLDSIRSLEGQGVRVRIAETIAWMVKWFVLILTLIVVSDTLGLTQVTSFLNQIALYIPQVIIAVVILAIGFVAGAFVQKLVVQAVTASRLPTSSSGFLGAVAKWAIIVFAFMTALIQLGIATNLLQILFTGFVAMLALAGGLAFGLGSKEHASKFLGRLSEDMRSGTRDMMDQR